MQEWLSIHDILMKIQGLNEHPLVESPVDRPSRTRAELMSDSAVYKRTSLGQRELLRAADLAGAPALRLLARFNGYTDLRRLIDLAPGDAREMPRAIAQLFADGLIELLDDST